MDKFEQGQAEVPVTETNNGTSAPSRSLGKQDVFVILFLLGFCLFIFKDIIIFDHLLFGSDFVSGYLGYKGFLFNEIHKNHAIPFWNPYIFSGIPFWAHFESTIFYPLHVLFWIMPPEKAYGYTMFAHFFLAGCFMYILGRSFHLSRKGSFVAAVVFTCNGFIMPILQMGQMFRVQGYAWIPLVIYFLNKAFTLRRTTFYATIAGLFWGMQILAGLPEDPFYTFFAAFLLLLARASSLRHAGSIGKLLIAMCLFFVVGAGIAAVQLVPAFEFIGQSVRIVLDRYDLVSLGSYPPEGIVTAVMPHFFGHYVSGDFWVSEVPWSIPHYSLYAGILPLTMLFFISRKGPDNGHMVFFAGSLAIVTFVWALGSHTPVYKLMYHLPGFNRIRAPAKIIALWVFALALLGGKGTDDLFNRRARSFLLRAGLMSCVVMALVLIDILCQWDQSFVLRLFSPFVLDQAIPEKMPLASATICAELRRLVVFSALILLSVLLWRRGALSPKVAVFSLCTLLLIDVSYVNKGAVPHNDGFYAQIREVKQRVDSNLGRDRDTFRVGSYDLVPNLEMVLGYQTVSGYTPLFPARYYEYINKYYEGQLPEAWVWFSYEDRPDHILMDLLNVKYEIRYGKGRYEQRKTCLPRAFVVPDHKILEKKAILEYLTSPEFDPKQVVLLEQDVDPVERSEPPAHCEGSENKVKIIKYRPDEIVIVTNTAEPGYLFLSEMYYPGWKATIDGHDRPILRGNYLFRVVQLPEGPHVVRLVFDPPSIKVGIGISVLTLFFAGCLIISGVVSKRGHSQNELKADGGRYS